VSRWICEVLGTAGVQFGLPAAPPLVALLLPLPPLELLLPPSEPLLPPLALAPPVLTVAEPATLDVEPEPALAPAPAVAPVPSPFTGPRSVVQPATTLASNPILHGFMALTSPGTETWEFCGNAETPTARS
jgi:hypothetical protein